MNMKMRKICGADSQLTKRKVKQLQGNFFVYYVRSRTTYPIQKKVLAHTSCRRFVPKLLYFKTISKRDKKFAVYVVREETETNSTAQTAKYF